ncbi:hypothetical protein SNE40_007241 [Patella caerulea]|uniref:Beta-lactamase-related domain-containing protein n=1 Tax=Patella caerulea TaxID=87958 RepID=A0AAN8K5J5_PATCE
MMNNITKYRQIISHSSVYQNLDKDGRDLFRFQRNVYQKIVNHKNGLKPYSSESNRDNDRDGSGLNLKILYSAVLGFAGFHLWKNSNCEENRENSINDLLPKKTLNEAINIARDLTIKVKDEYGCPGIVVAVSIDGKQVWSEGIGYSDVENRISCTPDTVMRIASISKPITMAVVGKLWEDGKLNIDKPIQQYLPDFPQKEVDGKKVQITTRQLVSHLSGIRHYDKKYLEKNKEKNDKNNDTNTPTSEFELKEYYLKKNFKNVTESLKLFQDDPLVHKPGSKFLYTSHGWTVVSAVVEAITKKQFADVIKDVFKQFGMEQTYLDENEPLIYNRSRNYIKNKKGKLVNAQYVDNSYKWAGGGYLSTVGDLLKFAHIMLYSLQANQSNSKKSGYLKADTMKTIWTLVDNTKINWDKDGGYGMGWGVVPEKQEYGCGRQQRYYVTHTGGAVGASSVLVILPPSEDNSKTFDSLPKGVCVTMITNLISVSLNKTALEIAKTFEQCDNK